MTPIGIAILFLPVALLIAGVAAWGSDRSHIGITAWALTIFGALVPAIYVIQSGRDNRLTQWRFMVAFGVVYFGIMVVFMLWLAA